MAVKFTNNAKTTLASGINSSVTTATVTDGSVFPTLAAGEHFYCTFDDGTNNEIVKVTARSGNTLTIIRGVDNTTARSFALGDAAELRATSALLTDIQENIAAKSANQTVYNTTTASSATDYDIGIDPSVEANAMVFLNGVMQHHDTFSFSGSTLTFDTAPPNGMALEVIVDNLINLQSSNLTVDTFTAADVGGNPQTDFTLSDAPAAEDNLLVFIDGVFQDQDAYTISNQTLTITDGVTADFGVTVYVINPVNIGTPSDGTVTSSKLSGNITMPADLTVTGDVAFDSPTFVVDNANSRVGIGTASPSTLLDIVGDVKMSANLTVDTDTLHVDATNNRVGIGTSSPSRQLHVNSGATNVVASFESTDSRAVAEFKDPSGTAELGNIGDDIYFAPAGTEKVRIDSSGNVGIGNSSPLGNLTISNAAGNNAPNTITAANTYLQLGSDDYGPNNDGKFMIGFGYTDATNTNSPAYIGFEETSTSGDTKGSLTFYTRDVITDTAPTQRMKITDGGSVGIGTSSPRSILDLDGGSETQLRLQTTNTGTTTGDGLLLSLDSSANAKAYLWNYENAEMIFGTNNTERMRIDASGNVGIGATPNFYQGGGLEIERAGVTTLRLQNTTSSKSAEIKIDTNLILETINSSSPIQFNTGATERMRIDASGKVGIGTGSPSKGKLVVSGASYDEGILVERTDTSSRWGLSGTDSGAFQIWDDNQGDSTRLIIDSSGNVGINTTSPSFKLDVAGDVQLGNVGKIKTVTNGLRAASTGSSGFSLRTAVSSAANPTYSNVDDTDTGMFFPATNELAFTTAGTESMRFDNSGKLKRNNFGVNVNEHMFKVISLDGPTSSATFTRTIDVNASFGYVSQGGFVMFALHGWQQDAAAGLIHWWNNGSGSDTGISTGGVGLFDFFTQNGITITVAAGTGTHEIDITIASAHSNPHGWRMVVWA